MVDSTWTARELPVLEVIVDAMEEHPVKETALREIAQRTGFCDEDLEKAMARLAAARPPYFEGITIEDLPYPIAVTSVTERALLETEAWPNPEGIVEALIASLVAAAESEDDPETRSRWRVLADGLASFAREVAVGVVTNKLSGL